VAISTEGGLELLELMTDGAGCHVQALGGTRDAPRAAHRVEDPQRSQQHAQRVHLTAQ
jgi:hypothetical protein